MSILFRTALAVAAIVAPTVAHADYVQYTFKANGSASVYNSTRNAFDFGYGQATLVYVVPLSFYSNGSITTTPTSETYTGFGDNSGDDGIYFQTGNSVTASGRTLAFGTSGFGSELQPNRISGAACSTGPLTRLPLGPINIDGACGSFAATFRDHRSASDYLGQVVSLSVQVVAGSLPEYGLQNFSFASGVPEPSTWALMLAGFGLVGYTLRKRGVSVALAPTA